MTRGREGTFSIAMYRTLPVHICQPNITAYKKQALSVGPLALSGVGRVHFLLFSGVGTCEFEFLEAIPKELDGGR